MDNQRLIEALDVTINNLRYTNEAGFGQRLKWKAQDIAGRTSFEAGRLANKAKAGAKKLGGAIKAGAGKTWDATKAGASKVGGAIKAGAGKTWDATKRAGGAIKTGAGKVGGAIKTGAGKTWDATKAGAGKVGATWNKLPKGGKIGVAAGLGAAALGAGAGAYALHKRNKRRQANESFLNEGIFDAIKNGARKLQDYVLDRFELDNEKDKKILDLKGNVINMERDLNHEDNRRVGRDKLREYQRKVEIACHRVETDYKYDVKKYDQEHPVAKGAFVGNMVGLLAGIPVSYLVYFLIEEVAFKKSWGALKLLSLGLGGALGSYFATVISSTLAGAGLGALIDRIKYGPKEETNESFYEDFDLARFSN